MILMLLTLLAAVEESVDNYMWMIVTLVRLSSIYLNEIVQDNFLRWIWIVRLPNEVVIF